MPPKSLTSMAKKAGKSVNDAERYWEDSKKSAKEQGYSGDRAYEYAMGVTKKRLGLEDVDLVSLGLPVGLVVESSLVEGLGSIKQVVRFDDKCRTLAALTIREMIAVEQGKKSRVVELGENGPFVTKRGLLLIEQADVSGNMDYWKRVWSGVPERYLEILTSYVPSNPQNVNK